MGSSKNRSIHVGNSSFTTDDMTSITKILGYFTIGNFITEAYFRRFLCTYVSTEKMVYGQWNHDLTILYLWLSSKVALIANDDAYNYKKKFIIQKIMIQIILFFFINSTYMLAGRASLLRDAKVNVRDLNSKFKFTVSRFTFLFFSLLFIYRLLFR